MTDVNPPFETSHTRPRLSSEALKAIRSAAEKGNPEAQYRLGMAYAQEEGVALDYREAATWIERAAVQGLASAQSALGWLYANGFGVKQDGGAAAHWYLKSAEQGNPQSQYLIASMYRVGSNGLEQSNAEMLKWYYRAAEQNFAPAQNMLGKLMARGKYVKENAIAAFQWLSLALLNGSESAKQELAELSKGMSQDQIEVARDMFRAGLQAQGVDVSGLSGDSGDSVGHEL